MSRPTAWFRTRDAGWRWGAPLTWQGGVTYGLLAIALIDVGHYFPPRQVPAQFIGVALLVSAAFVALCWAKGDQRVGR